MIRKHTKNPTILILFGLFLGLVACKPNNSDITKAPNSQSQSQDNSVEAPGPLSNNANDQELRRQFLALVSKYKSQSQKEFGLTSTKITLDRDRRPKALNIKMRAPTAMIAKTAGTQGAGDQGAAIRAAGGKIRKELATANMISVTFPDAKDDRYMAAVMEFLGQDHRTARVEPDYRVSLSELPNDPRFSELWGLRNLNSNNDINVAPVWDKTTGSRDVVVGVIDSGIDCTHPDLAANCWVNPGEDGSDSNGKNKRTNGVDDDGNGYIDDWRGWNFINETNNAMDDNKHGTHVAGTIGAIGNNAEGVVGVNWQVSLVPLKFLGSSGSGYLSDAIEAIDYATKMKFFATNNSWGGGGYSDLMVQVIERANSAGILFVAAAGNHAGDNDKNPSYPSSYESSNIIAVAATTSTGRLTSFSCYGKNSVDVAAPGDSILSTVPGGSYASLRGTSMATPHVTGALALLKAQFPNEMGQTLRNRLFQSVSLLPDTTDAGKIKSGGVINVAKALLQTPDMIPPSTPSNLVVVSRDFERRDSKEKKYEATMRAYISFQGSTDNDPTGKPKNYQLRISESPITDEKTWASATQLTIESIEAGAAIDNKVTVIVRDAPLSFNGFIAARAYDNSDNVSAISESVKFRTINLTARETYDASDPINYGFGWVIEDDPVRGKVYSDAVGYYPNNASTRMILRTFTIPDGFNRLALRYWTRYSIDSWESSFWGPADFGRVYIHGSGTTPWKIDEVTGRSGWVQRTIDLTEVAWEQKSRGNDSVFLSFELSSDADTTDTGWLIDDIEILVNDTMLRTKGAPRDISSNGTVFMSFESVAGALYSAKLMEDGFRGCAIANYNETESSTLLTTPFSMNLGAQYGLKSVCVRSKIPGITNLVYINHRWMYESAASIVEASGYPTGTNNTKSFPLKVQPSAGSSATHYKYALTSNYDNTPLDQLCYKQPPRLEYSDWIPVSQVSTLNIPMTQGYTNSVLCVYGKAPDGSTQLTPRVYSWLGEYEPPQIQIINPPLSTNNLSSVKITLTANEPLSACKVRLTKNPTGDCSPVTNGYTDCSKLLEHVFTLQDDGDYGICMYGIDKAGNISERAARTYWRRDATPPTVELSGKPPTNAKSSPAQIYLKVNDLLFYQFSTATAPEACGMWSPKTLAHLPINLSLIPGGDGPRVLCVKGIDHVGNVQPAPTVMRWTQDTIIQPLTFTNIPLEFSRDKTIDVKVGASEPGTYSYALVSGSGCDGANVKWSPARPLTSNIIETLPAAEGTYTLCGRFTDSAGNTQDMPTRHTWTRLTIPPTALVTSGLPLSPNSASTINMTIGGANVYSYTYALVNSQTSDCRSGVTYNINWSLSTTPLSITVPNSSNAFMTLCIVGADWTGYSQLQPTIYRWLRHESAPAQPSAVIFAAIKQSTKRANSQTMIFTRSGTSFSSETATALMCKFTPQTGAVGSCMRQSVSFSARQASASVNFGKMTRGTWITVLLPQNPARGRAEPLVFTY